MQSTGSATVFHVSDLDRKHAYYRDVLGFEEDFRFGNYAGVKLGLVNLHLVGSSDQDQNIGAGQVYVFCDEVDEYYSAVASRGATMVSPPCDTAYGLRDFMLADHDGNRLSFGRDI